MRYDVILWDMDDTLLDFSYSMEHALTKCLEEIEVKVSKEMIARYADINKGWWSRLEQGLVSKRALLSGRFTDLFDVYQIECPDLTTFINHYQEYLGCFFSYVDYSMEVCNELKGKCRQCIVTNGVLRTQLAKLKKSGFYEIMDDFFVSEQLGAPKPARLFFERVLETMPQISKDRILIVGDSLTSDMRGGYNAGIHTCWYNPDRKQNDTEIRINYKIQDLREVLSIVEG